MSASSEYLLQRLTETARLEDADDRWASEDLQDLTLEVAEFVRDRLDVPALDLELIARSQLDTAAIAWLIRALGAIAAANAGAFQLEIGLGTGVFIDWESRLSRLNLVVASLESPQELDQLEVSLRLGLGADGAIDTLLAALPVGHPLKAQIESRLLAKLALLTDDKAMELWAGLRFEVDPAREVHFEVESAIAPKEFFDLGDLTEVRGRIARYLAVVRPALEKRMSERGAHIFPANLIGIGSILSWTKTPSTTDWTPRMRAAVRALGRVSALWRSGKDDLAQALGVPVEGYFLGGRGQHEAKASAPADSAPRSYRLRTLDELTKLVRIADQHQARIEGSVERVLRAFKLGLEVAAQDIAGDHRMKDELYVQRVLLRFLVERDIPAFGTKFGQSEVDIRADDPLGAVVIETKILRQGLSNGTLNRWLTQLGSYMDQAHVALRGALVIFNYGNAPILAPVSAVRFRFLIVAVNLCSASPSRRISSVEIEETNEGEDAVRLVRFGEAPEKKKPKR